MQDLAGRTAFVSGAASGIGFGVAAALAEAGVKVMLCDIDELALRRAVTALRSAGADVEGVRADVSLKADLSGAAQATVDRFGKVHIVVNNAGVLNGRDYGHWTDADWEWSIGVNLMSVVWGFEIFGPLIEGHGDGGHIVSTASIAGLIPTAASQYSVTKAAVIALSEGLRPILAARGVGVSVVCPGWVRTQIAEQQRAAPQRHGEGVGGVSAQGPGADFLAYARGAIARGLDPMQVGFLVRDGILRDLPYIFTDSEFEGAVEERFAAIRGGFDQLRRPDAGG